MKRISIICLTGLLFLTACENTGSSTVGKYEQEETSPSSEKSEGGSHGEQAKEKTESTVTDTLKTSSDTAGAGAHVHVEGDSAHSNR
jgi:hypothetical protein